MDTRSVNYIVTNHTEIRPRDDLFAAALPMVEVTQVVRSRIRARRTLVLLDTCHSGAATAGAQRLTEDVGESSVSSETLDAIRQGFGRAVIASSQAGQKSFENDEAKNGYFTYYLLQAMKKRKGQDSIDRVYAYVADGVSKGVAAKFQMQQTPVLSQSEQGAEIVLGMVVAETAASPNVGHL
jgi:hypothetical protein